AGAVCGKAARTDLCGGRAMKRTSLPLQRREFITLLGSAGAMWPLAARAQQPAMPVIGFLRSTSLADATHLTAALGQGLGEAGFIEGQNVAIEYRSAENRADQLPVVVAELVRRQVGLIVGNARMVKKFKLLKRR